MKQSTDKQDIVCTQYSYAGIPFLHADMKGNLFVREHEEKGRFFAARKITVTLNNNARRIKFKGRVYYFSRLKKLAFKEKNTIVLGKKIADELPF